MIDYLNRIRTEKAKELLNDEGVNIYEVSKNVGFNDVSTFIRTFKKYEGITPGKYKGIKGSL
jgi:AraC-type DNA-binding domain-containing proteins